MTVDHIGIAVRSINDAVQSLVGLLGLDIGEQDELAGDRVRIAFLSAGNLHLELLEPLGEGPVMRFLATRGEGVHHIAFLVEDLPQTLARAQANGFRLIDERPRLGARGRLIAFVHPKSTHGVLIEFVQNPSSKFPATPGAR